jgi:hypothetical protein
MQSRDMNLEFVMQSMIFVEGVCLDSDERLPCRETFQRSIKSTDGVTFPYASKRMNDHINQKPHHINEGEGTAFSPNQKRGMIYDSGFLLHQTIQLKNTQLFKNTHIAQRKQQIIEEPQKTRKDHSMINSLSTETTSPYFRNGASGSFSRRSSVGSAINLSDIVTDMRISQPEAFHLAPVSVPSLKKRKAERKNSMPKAVSFSEGCPSESAPKRRRYKRRGSATAAMILATAKQLDKSDYLQPSEVKFQRRNSALAVSTEADEDSTNHQLLLQRSDSAGLQDENTTL